MDIQKDSWRAGWKDASQDGREEDGERWGKSLGQWRGSGTDRGVAEGAPTESLQSAGIAFQRAFSLPHGWGWEGQLGMGTGTRKKEGFPWLSLQSKESTVARFTLETFIVKEDAGRKGNMCEGSL